MYCTGGIRCEKASALMQDMGFDEVYHLKGGILKYLEDVPAANSQWQGECFVFDGRVAVDHDLQPGSYDMCHACRMPLSTDDLAHPDFEDGISCPIANLILIPTGQRALPNGKNRCDLPPNEARRILAVNPRRKKTSPSSAAKRLALASMRRQKIKNGAFWHNACWV
jgi:UPF0176 protein